MKIVTVSFFFLLAFSLSVSAQKTKFLLGEKVDFEKIAVKDLAKIDQEIKDKMDNFFGIGFNLSAKIVDESVQENDVTKKTSAIRLQMGFQLPKFIKTNPPQKIFKLGWDVGISKVK